MSKAKPTKKPAFKKPDYWTDDPPPQPSGAKPGNGADEDPAGLSPTRYGDWVKDGIAIDF
ncbi:DUF1674 domain-containing protein [Altericroceibacterium endophyticum]|uniref:DUF1674 domain-containing protein n=1 Tax=Altericroceibacterium endophyticum TaxID=1808508 RepID=A0A6I4T4T7_9SPHN|nr:DUF1674 domain-containing protein [Altericroceibacterium endophyticum]MXO65161.1 DUF1674 domain-containing protein [Altericroceibacterium endophyticum]